MDQSRRDFNRLALGATAGALLARNTFAAKAPADNSLAGPAGLSLSEAAAQVRSGKLTSVALTKACLDRIEVYQPKLLAFITVMKQQALAQAAQLDAEAKAGKFRGALHGVPLGIKDIIDTAGTRTTGGSALFEDRVPTEDAPVVARLRKAGAVIIGKTNTQEFAMGGGEVSYFGASRNPWNLAHNTGGSSSGSGAALAAFLCQGALGTDTGGSVRMPASYCGLVGMKATYGLVPIHGIMPLTMSLDHCGPMTRTVRDNAMMLGVMAGYDRYDITSVDHAAEDYVAQMEQPVSGLRLGLPAGYFDDLDPEVGSAVEAAAALLGKLTRGIADCTLPGVTHLANLGGLGETLAWHEQYFRNQPGKYMLNERRRLQAIADAKPLATDYIRAKWELETVRRHVDDAFRDFDLVVLPTQRILAPTLDELITRANEGKTANPRVTSNTQPFNVMGVPAISIPCGFSRSGLPIGLMIAGPRFSEGRIYALARAYEAATNWHERRPPLTPQTPVPARHAVPVSTLRRGGPAAAPADVRRAVPRRSRALALLLAGLAAATAAPAKDVPLAEATIADLQAALAAGTTTSEKLVRLYLARVDAYDDHGPAINAVITVNPKALETARALDRERRAKGPRGPLHGIPVVLKDNFDTFDLPTTGGSLLLEGSIPHDDAFVVNKLRDAGAIVLAKVNLSEFASGGAHSSLGGQTLNPHDLTRTPSGSSGGTGAAIAADYAPLGLGTDTGGSIRGPSTSNGIVGLKPTHGLLSRDGIIPLALSFDTGGPMARSVRDIAIALGPMTGVDPADPATQKSQGRAHADYTGFLDAKALQGARIGIARDFLGQDAEVDWVVESALAAMRAAGATVVDVHYPKWLIDSRAEFYSAMRYPEFAAQIGDYLKTTGPGYPKDIRELIARADGFRSPRPDGAGPNPSRWNLMKREAASGSLDDRRYTVVRDHGLPMVRAVFDGLFEGERLDAIVYPTSPRRPAQIASTAAEGGVGSATNFANLTGYPDLIVPAGFTGDDLPVGLSFFGPAFSEPKLLALGHAFEQATHAIRVPKFTPARPGETVRVP